MWGLCKVDIAGGGRGGGGGVGEGERQISMMQWIGP